MTFFLGSLGLMIVAAAAALLLSRVARVPSIVAYILAGLLLGPVTGLLTVTDAIDTISQVGVVLLLFLVGLELSLEKLRDVGRVALVAGFGQVVLTGASGMALSLLLGFPLVQAIFITTALTISSTVVPVKLLTEKGEMDTLYGRIVVGVFLVQNVVVILILTFLTGLGGVESLDVGSMAIGLARAFGGIAVLVVAALLASRYVLPAIFGWIANSLEALFIWSLCWCFLLVVVADALQLSVELGGFVAGLSLAQLPYSLELRRRVHPLMNFFMAIFFTSLGIGVGFDASLSLWGPALVLSAGVLIANPASIIWLVARVGYDRETAFLASVTAAQISEFSFIFAAMGLSTGLIDERVLSIITFVGIVTMAVSAYLIRYNHELYDKVRGWRVLALLASGAPDEPAADAVGDVEAAGPPSGHVIVIGMNSLGVRVVRELVERGETVLAIDTDPGKLEPLECATLLGSIDHPGVLDEANLSGAKLVVSALQIEDTNNLLTWRCHELGIPCSIHAFDRSVVDELRGIGANHLIIPRNNGIKRMIEEMRNRGLLES